MTTAETLKQTSLACLQSKPVAQGDASLPRNVSGKAQSDRSSAPQPVQEMQRQLPQSTAPSNECQPWLGSSPAAVNQLALPNLASETDGEQPIHAAVDSCLGTPDLSPSKRFCIPASRDVDESVLLQQVQHCELGASQEQIPGGAPDAECPGTAAAETWQNNMCGLEGEALSGMPATPMQLKGIAQLKQHPRFLSTQTSVVAQSDNDNTAGLQLQSTSHGDAEGVTQQHTDKCSNACVSGGLEQHLFSRLAPCPASGELQQSSAELATDASARSSSSSPASEACSGDQLHQLTASTSLLCCLMHCVTMQGFLSFC